MYSFTFEEKDLGNDNLYKYDRECMKDLFSTLRQLSDLEVIKLE